jgi:hypothetical protein
LLIKLASKENKTTPTKTLTGDKAGMVDGDTDVRNPSLDYTRAVSLSPKK